jgi:hypothetical protein
MSKKYLKIAHFFFNCPKIVQKLSQTGLQTLLKSCQKVGEKLFKVVKKKKKSCQKELKKLPKNCKTN